MIGILLTVLFFGLAITVHEAGHFLTAKASGIKVNEFAIGMGPAVFHFQKGETKYALRLFPIGGYVSMEGESEDSNDKRAYNNVSVYKRMIVILAGAFMNFVLGVLFIGILLVAGGDTVTTTVADVSDDYPAAYAVLQPGDRITEINGHRLLCAQDLQFELSQLSLKEPITITVKRGDDTLTFEDVGTVWQDESGNTRRALGVTLATEPVSITNLIPQTVGNAVFDVKLVWESLVSLVTGQVSWTQVSGPVGVTQVVEQAHDYGWLSVISLFAFLTINIGVFNLLPFPALDGGQFVFLLIEAIRKKPIKREIQSAVNLIGFGVLIFIIILVTAKDIMFLF